jgi:hypothetical protein
MHRRRPTILISGMIATSPNQGGLSWMVMQYLLGFRRLEYQVVFVEQLQESSLVPAHASLEASANAAYFKTVMAECDLTHASSLMLRRSEATVGLSRDAVRDIAKSADALINISGWLDDPELTSDIPVRVYIDVDPGFTQLWQAVDRIDMRFGDHTHYFTVGPNILLRDSPVPTCGIEWMTTLPPVVLTAWRPGGAIKSDGLTTVANWRGYGSIDYAGISYGQKAHSLREFMALPMMTDERFMLALAIHPDETRDVEAMAANRWTLLDADSAAATPRRYHAFVQGSKAEFGIAKSGYVRSRCGWFSDRSVCYLASGRPVIAQDTGFTDFLPTGNGLFSFQTADDVLTSIDSMNQDYPRHAAAARTIAEEYFDSDKVLTRLMARAGIAA